MEAFFDTPSSPKKGSQTSRPIKYHEIQSIVRMGLSAPTGDNAQHWRFTWNDQTLAIFYVKELGEHALNNNHHATYLSLGCLLESMSISASSFSLEVSYQLCTECEEDKPIALLTFNRSFKKTDPLVSEVLRRQTVRGALSREKMSAELKLLLDREVEKFENCRLAIYDEKDKQLLDYLLFCDELMWKNKKVSVDLLKWVRLSEKEISETRDGMPWQTLEVNTVERFMLRLFRVYPSVISLLWYLGFKFKINFLTKKAFRNHSFIYCIQVKNNKEGGVDRTSLLDSGRLSYRLWLILQAEDYGVQPYSIASLTAFDVVSGHAPPGTSQQAKMKLTQGMSLLKKTFQTQEGFSPLWMFRSGKFLYGSQAPQTLRVDVHSRLKVYTRYN